MGSINLQGKITPSRYADIAIQGNGFFIAKHKSGGDLVLTRDGSFRPKKYGLTNSEGYVLYGYKVEPNYHCEPVYHFCEEPEKELWKVGNFTMDMFPPTETFCDKQKKEKLNDNPFASLTPVKLEDYKTGVFKETTYLKFKLNLDPKAIATPCMLEKINDKENPHCAKIKGSKISPIYKNYFYIVNHEGKTDPGYTEMSFIKRDDNLWEVDISLVYKGKVISENKDDQFIAKGEIRFNPDGTLRSVDESLKNIKVKWGNVKSQYNEEIKDYIKTIESDGYVSHVRLDFGTEGKMVCKEGGCAKKGEAFGKADGLSQYSTNNLANYDSRFKTPESDGLVGGVFKKYLISKNGMFQLEFIYEGGTPRYHDRFTIPLAKVKNYGELELTSENTYRFNQENVDIHQPGKKKTGLILYQYKEAIKNIQFEEGKKYKFKLPYEELGDYAGKLVKNEDGTKSLAVDGNGFFIMLCDDDKYYFSRNFKTVKEKSFESADGCKLMGWEYNLPGNPEPETGVVKKITSKLKLKPIKWEEWEKHYQPTKEIKIGTHVFQYKASPDEKYDISKELMSKGEYTSHHHPMVVAVFDSLGMGHTIKFGFVYSAIREKQAVWSCEVYEYNPSSNSTNLLLTKGEVVFFGNGARDDVSRPLLGMNADWKNGASVSEIRFQWGIKDDSHAKLQPHDNFDGIRFLKSKPITRKPISGDGKRLSPYKEIEVGHSGDITAVFENNEDGDFRLKLFQIAFATVEFEEELKVNEKGYLIYSRDAGDLSIVTSQSVGVVLSGYTEERVIDDF